MERLSTALHWLPTGRAGPRARDASHRFRIRTPQAACSAASQGGIYAR